MTDLLARYAECFYWFGRYTERATCLARVLEVQSSISRGKTTSAANWQWLLTLHDDHAAFARHYDEVTVDAVASFYVIDRENPGSLYSTIRAARENARTLRAAISTELWLQVNQFYNRFRSLPSVALSPSRLSPTCQLVKKECYAQLGVAEATLYRDASWCFFQLGVLVERADQMSRLLDVRFALRHSLEESPEASLGDFGFWSLLLRSAAAQQAYMRASQGRREPQSVARFLILAPGLPRSISFCVWEMDRVLTELRQQFQLRSGSGALEQLDILQQNLAVAASDDNLIEHLHDFNDGVQGHLITFSQELSFSFFGADRPAASTTQDQSGSSAPQSQRQSSN